MHNHKAKNTLYTYKTETYLQIKNIYIADKIQIHNISFIGKGEAFQKIDRSSQCEHSND